MTVKSIIAIVAKFYNIHSSEIVGSSRHTDVVMPRHIAMYLARHITRKSYPCIGRQFRGRDHTTVLSACKRVDGLMQTDSTVAVNVARLVEIIQAHENTIERVGETARVQVCDTCGRIRVDGDARDKMIAELRAELANANHKLGLDVGAAA